MSGTATIMIRSTFYTVEWKPEQQRWVVLDHTGAYAGDFPTKEAALTYANRRLVK